MRLIKKFECMAIASWFLEYFKHFFCCKSESTFDVGIPSIYDFLIKSMKGFLHHIFLSGYSRPRQSIIFQFHLNTAVFVTSCQLKWKLIASNRTRADGSVGGRGVGRQGLIVPLDFSGLGKRIEAERGNVHIPSPLNIVSFRRFW